MADACEWKADGVLTWERKETSWKEKWGREGGQ